MNNFSTVQAGNLTAIVGVIMLILNAFKVNVSNEEVTVIIGGFLSVAGILHSWYKRYKVGDVTLGGFKKY